MYYEEVRESIQSGDMVLFSGKGLISWLIKKATRSPWSHVGVAVRVPEFDFVCLWESTTLSTVPDLFTRKPTKGVQLVPLSDRVNGYTGKVAVRHLHVLLNESERVKAMAVRRKLRGKPYERKPWQLVRAALDWRFSANRRDLSSVFCSEGAAEFYMAANRLHEDGKASSEYTPADLGKSPGWGIPQIVDGKEPNIIVG